MKKALLLFALVAISAVSINAQDTQVLKQSWDCRRMRMVVVPIWTSLHCLH